MMRRLASIASILALALLFASHPCVAADQPRLVDDAGLLTPSERAAVTKKLDEVSGSSGIDVVVVTTDRVSQRGVTADADDFYDENGYGTGPEHDGIMLFLAMADRDWAISTEGFGIRAFTDAGQAHIMSFVRPLLSDGDYAEAFIVFADMCGEFVAQARSGSPYDVGNLPRGAFPLARNLGIALAAGVLLAIIVVMGYKGQLKTIRPRNEAADYVKRGSMSLRDSRDVFLYSTLTRTARPKSSSSGGSSTHTSSSGRTHGGSSGKF